MNVQVQPLEATAAAGLLTDRVHLAFNAPQTPLQVEGVIRVPTVIRWPAGHPGGRRENASAAGGNR